MTKSEIKHPKGYWMGVGISVGVAIGVALGPLFENIGIGIALGIALGSGIGASLERRHKDDLRPLTEQEQKRQKWGIAIGLVLTTVLMVFLIIVYLMQTR